jgi:signal transduction histidine kinase/integral membrane sensor domain MASE1
MLQSIRTLQRRPFYRRSVTTAMFGLAYLIFGKLSLLLAIAPGYATPLFPSAGVALAGVLLYGYRTSIGIWLGCFLLTALDPGEFLRFNHSPSGLLLSAIVATGVVAEAVVGAFLIRRFETSRMLLTSISDIGKFLFLGAFVAVTVGATSGVGALFLFGVISKEAFAYNWWNWWVGDGIGIFVSVPILFSLFAEPRPLWRKRIGLVGLPLIVIICIYVIVFIQASTWERKSTRQSLENVGTVAVAQLEKSFEGYLNALYALESVLSVEGNDELRMFENVGQRWIGLYSGIYDLTWSPRVRREERSDHERRARESGFPDYEIREPAAAGGWVRSPEAEEYFPSRFVTPNRTHDVVMGFNQKTNDERNRTMERSRDTGRPAAVGPTRLYQKVSFRKALIVFAPVFSGDHETIEDRRKNLVGYLKAVFSLEDVIAASLKDFPYDYFRILIFDDEPSRGKLVFPVDVRSDAVPRLPSFDTKLQVADRPFWVRVVPTEAYIHRQRGPGPWIMLASGFLISALLTAFLLSITGHAFNIEKQLTEKNMLSAKLQRSAEELRQSNADLEQFAYVASHDLKEPLRTVASYLQLIERRLGKSLDQDTRDFMDFAIDGAQRMSAMIADLLAYARIGKTGRKSEPTDIQSVINAALQNLTTAIQERTAKITVTSLPVFYLDYLEGVLLFQNLIDNALKYHDGNRPAEVEISSRKENGVWVFSVRDNGIGISKDYLANIFLMFKRAHTRNEYSGNGIGLAMCKKIVERHGGKIWVESKPGEGSRFSFVIPPIA